MGFKIGADKTLTDDRGHVTQLPDDAFTAIACLMTGITTLRYLSVEDATRITNQLLIWVDTFYRD